MSINTIQDKKKWPVQLWYSNLAESRSKERSKFKTSNTESIYDLLKILMLLMLYRGKTLESNFWCDFLPVQLWCLDLLSTWHNWESLRKGISMQNFLDCVRLWVIAVGIFLIGLTEVGCPTLNSSSTIVGWVLDSVKRTEPAEHEVQASISPSALDLAGKGLAASSSWLCYYNGAETNPLSPK